MNVFIIYSILANAFWFTGIGNNFYSEIPEKVFQEILKTEKTVKEPGLRKNPENLGHLILSFQEPAEWNLSVEGFSPAYYDETRGAIAVNTVEQPTDQWAAASTTFDQPSGIYTIRFTSLLESDGECSYVLKIGGKKVMNFQNPSIYGKDIEEYAPHEVEVKNITIEKGSLIQVEFLPHSNGLVPEGDGFGFARGRWKNQIGFLP